MRNRHWKKMHRCGDGNVRISESPGSLSTCFVSAIDAGISEHLSQLPPRQGWLVLSLDIRNDPTSSLSCPALKTTPVAVFWFSVSSAITPYAKEKPNVRGTAAGRFVVLRYPLPKRRHVIWKRVPHCLSTVWPVEYRKRERQPDQ